MDGQIVAIYCLCDDLLKALHHVDDRQRQMSDAQVMTAAIVAMLYFSGNFERARAWLHLARYLPWVLSRSRFNRRLQAVQALLSALFVALGACFKDLNAEAVYVIDSFPVPVCDNIRIGRCQLYQEEAYRGYTASKRRYFYGVKLVLLSTGEGQPIEALLMPGATADVRALDGLALALPQGSTLYGDSAFTFYEIEEWLWETARLTLLPMRKVNSTRPVPPWTAYLQGRRRKIVETAGSQVDRLMPRNIHAVTAQGFELKVMLFVLAYSVSFVV